jgi:hypothetical protein
VRRGLVVVVALVPGLGCVSDEAIRRVEVSPLQAAPRCYLVHEQLEGRGENLEKATEHLRKRAARVDANYVALSAEPKGGWDPVAMQMAPWSLGRVVIVRGNAYACPPAPPSPPSTSPAGD